MVVCAWFVREDVYIVLDIEYYGEVSAASESRGRGGAGRVCNGQTG